MSSSAFFLALVCIFCLFLCFLKSWSSTLILAFVEVAWVSLCSLYAQQLFLMNDVYMLFWACILLFFSAVELAASALGFLIVSGLTNLSAPLSTKPTIRQT